MDVVCDVEAVLGDCPAPGMPEDVSEGEFDVCALGFPDTAERPVVNVEPTDGIVPVPVLPKENQRFIVLVFTDEGTGWQVELLECGSDTLLGPVLANDVEMHTFHHQVGVVDKPRERPRKHPFLPIDVRGVDLNHERGVGTGDVWDLILKRAFRELSA